VLLSVNQPDNITPVANFLKDIKQILKKIFINPILRTVTQNNNKSLIHTPDILKILFFNHWCGAAVNRMIFIPPKFFINCNFITAFAAYQLRF